MERERAAVPWQVQFVLLSAIWGCSFLFIKVGDQALAPVQVALGRLLCGSVTLLIIVSLRSERLPRGLRVWGHLSVAALLLNAAPFTLFAYGETRISSVLAGIWNATTPLLTLLVAMMALPDEHPSKEKIAGLLAGFAGVLVVLGFWRGGGGQDPLGTICCVAAAACYSLGFPYARRYLTGRPESTLALSSAQLLCGTAIVAILTPFLSTSHGTLTAPVVGSVAVLGALGTGLAYVLNYGVIRGAGATAASTVTYLIPVFSTLAGVLILREPATWNQPVGALIVLGGAALAGGRVRVRERSGPPRPHQP